MKRQFVLALILAVLGNGVCAQDIKGIRLGMTKKQIDALHPNGAHLITVAGVEHALRPAFDLDPSNPAAAKVQEQAKDLMFEYTNGKLSLFTFPFDAKHFDIVFAAVKAKYPQLECKENRRSTCRYKDLILGKDGTDGLLVLRSAEAEESRVKKAIGDI